MSKTFNGLLGVEESKDLLRVYDRLQHMDEDIRARTLSAATQQLAAGWPEELDKSHAYNHAQEVIVKANPTAVAHLLGITVATGGSAAFPNLTRPFEFGSLNREQFTTYQRTNKSGSRTSVTRRTQRQIPPRSTRGWIAYPAAQRWSRRVFGMFLQIVVKAGHNAVEPDGGS